MTVQINGEEKRIRDNITVAELLKELEIEPLRVAVEVNLNIVKKCDYEQFRLSKGDSVEIVSFVGGG